MTQPHELYWQVNLATLWKPMDFGMQLIFENITASITAGRKTGYMASITSTETPTLNGGPFQRMGEAKSWCESYVRFFAKTAVLQRQEEVLRGWLHHYSEEVSLLRAALHKAELEIFQATGERKNFVHQQKETSRGHERFPFTLWHLFPSRLMTAPTFLRWLADKTIWLSEKRKREQKYLNDRVWKQQRGRGRRTQTDVSYEADAPHEEELLLLLAELALATSQNA